MSVGEYIPVTEELRRGLTLQSVCVGLPLVRGLWPTPWLPDPVTRPALLVCTVPSIRYVPHAVGVLTRASSVSLLAVGLSS